MAVRDVGQQGGGIDPNTIILLMEMRRQQRDSDRKDTLEREKLNLLKDQRASAEAEKRLGMLQLWSNEEGLSPTEKSRRAKIFQDEFAAEHGIPLGMPETNAPTKGDGPNRGVLGAVEEIPADVNKAVTSVLAGDDNKLKAKVNKAMKDVKHKTDSVRNAARSFLTRLGDDFAKNGFKMFVPGGPSPNSNQDLNRDGIPDALQQPEGTRELPDMPTFPNPFGGGGEDIDQNQDGIPDDIRESPVLGDAFSGAAGLVKQIGSNLLGSQSNEQLAESALLAKQQGVPNAQIISTLSESGGMDREAAESLLTDAIIKRRRVLRRYGPQGLVGQLTERGKI